MLTIIGTLISTYVLSYILTRKCLIIINNKEFMSPDAGWDYEVLQFMFWIPIFNIAMSSCYYVLYILESKGINADKFFRIKDKDKE